MRVVISSRLLSALGKQRSRERRNRRCMRAKAVCSQMNLHSTFGYYFLTSVPLNRRMRFNGRRFISSGRKRLIKLALYVFDTRLVNTPRSKLQGNWFIFRSGVFRPSSILRVQCRLCKTRACAHIHTFSPQHSVLNDW